MSALRDAGHDVEWTGTLERDPGDREILDMALRDGRALVTLDKDFGELAVALRQPHSGIIRLVGFPARRQAAACLVVVDRYAAEIEAGAIVTAEPGRVRIRPADTGPSSN